MVSIYETCRTELIYNVVLHCCVSCSEIVVVVAVVAVVVVGGVVVTVKIPTHLPELI